MNAVSLKYYIQTQIIMAEIEAMKVANLECERHNQTSYTYNEKAFQDKAEQLDSLHTCLHEAWGRGFAE